MIRTMSVERKKLETIKSDLETLREKQMEAQTVKKLLLKNLKTKFNIDSVEEGLELIEEKEEEIEQQEEDIEKRIKALMTSLKAEGLM